MSSRSRSRCRSRPVSLPRAARGCAAVRKSARAYWCGSAAQGHRRGRARRSRRRPSVMPVELSEVLDDEPALPPELVELCMWVADYYEAPPGEVVRAALPAGSGIEARRVIALTAAVESRRPGWAARCRQAAARCSPCSPPAARGCGLGAARSAMSMRLARTGWSTSSEQRDRGAGPAQARADRELDDRPAAARAAVASPKRRAMLDALAEAAGRSGASGAIAGLGRRRGARAGQGRLRSRIDRARGRARRRAGRCATMASATRRSRR